MVADQIVLPYLWRRYLSFMRALVGSVDYWNTAIAGRFNVAVDGLRQPGSAFKPFTYLEAFRQGHASLSMAFFGDPEIQHALGAAGMQVRDQHLVYAAATARWAGFMDERHWYFTSADEDG